MYFEKETEYIKSSGLDELLRCRQKISTGHCSRRLSLLKIDWEHLKTERCIILHPSIFIQQTPKVFVLRYADQ
jgi:hypothetical protein